MSSPIAGAGSPAEACDPFSWKPFHIYKCPRTIISAQMSNQATISQLSFSNHRFSFIFFLSYLRITK
ncbi:hypothetical protein AHAS_Ahas17G0243700 [Arachis hypogaea]